ncbi:hypothetical protein VCHA53O466_50400 [Vibrio chagasii]|nr:hypothetical protein VCHA53O466_50400 [Vibrio chagasii]
MSNRTFSDFVFLPYTKEAFFAFTENLALRLKEDTNGQFNRKPSWLGHRIVESLPNKPKGFNRHTLLDEMRAVAESSESEVSEKHILRLCNEITLPDTKPTSLPSHERVSAANMKENQDPTESFSASLDTSKPMKLSQMIVNVELTKSLGELKHFFKGLDAGHHEKLVLSEMHAVSESYDMHEACNLLEELLSNDFYIDNSGYGIGYVNDTLDRLLEVGNLENTKAIHELNQCVKLLTSEIKQFSQKGESTVYDSLDSLITENPQYKFELMQIAKNIADTNNTFDICEDADDPDGFNWTVYWGLSESMSFKSKMEAVLFTADKCLNVVGSFHYSVDHRHGSCASESTMKVKLRVTLDLLHVIGAAHLVPKATINTDQPVFLNSVEDMCSIVDSYKAHKRRKATTTSPQGRKERTKPLSALNAYLLRTFTDIMLKGAASEAISSAIVDTINGNNEFGEDVYNKANDDSNGILGERLASLEKQLKLDLGISKRSNTELRLELMSWAANPTQAESINEVHSEYLNDYERSLPFSEQQFIVAVIAAKERLDSGLYGALQEIGGTCLYTDKKGEDVPAVLKKSLNGEYILNELTKLIYDNNYIILD